MRIVVTGASGRLGQYAVKELMNHGHEITPVDKVATEPYNSIRTGNLDNTATLCAVFAGHDAILHLARENFPYTHEGFEPATQTWKSPDNLGDAQRFNYNVNITYNVLAVALELRIPRLVLGSSLTAYGFYYPARRTTPEYLPVDEKHPSRPQDPYSASKLVGEEICSTFARRESLKIASLRFAGITTDLSHETLLLRRKDPLRWSGALWSYIDVRDAAIACRLALESLLPGHHIYNICAPTTIMALPTLELAREYFPDVEVRVKDPQAHWSGYDPSRAKIELGFAATHLLDNKK
jgi:nucleoside-diphosphate-sugar epimerase